MSIIPIELSRRTLPVAALAGVTAAIIAAVAAPTIKQLKATIVRLEARIVVLEAEIVRLNDLLTPPPPPVLPQVQPLSAQVVHDTIGICDHPNFTGAYDARHDVLAGVAAAGVARIRGQYPDNDTDAAATVAACREFGIKWTATVYATESKPSDLKVAGKIRKIASNAADVIDRIEGPNEWNNSRTGGTPLTAAQAVAAQRNIFTTVRSLPALDHVRVLGPPCHDPTVASHLGKDWADLAAAGILDYQDAAAVHSYPAGQEVDNGLDSRLGYVYAAYGAGYPVEITEGGWTTGGDTGHVKVTETAAARRTERAPFIMAARGIRYDLYEALDEHLTKGGDAFGVYEVQTSGQWLAKPAVAALLAAQALTMDPGDPYTPAPVGVQVDGDCIWHLFADRDGVATLVMWQEDLTAPAVTVTVTDQAGPRLLPVGPELVALQLR